MKINDFKPLKKVARFGFVTVERVLSSPSRRVLLGLLAVVFLLISSEFTVGQGNLGSISGSVTDPNGAVVVGATVTATDRATKSTRTATTNESGIYVLANLPVGEYDLLIKASGFSDQKAEGVKVSVAFTNTVDVTVSL